MGRSWAWHFDVLVKYRGPDQKGVMREWTVVEPLIGIGTGDTTEAVAREIAERRLATEHWRAYLLRGHPADATLTLGPGWLYEEHLPDYGD